MHVRTRTAALGGALLLAAAVGGCSDDDDEALDREECINSAVAFLNSLDPDDLEDVDEEDEFNDRAREELGDECFALIDTDLTDEETAAMFERVDIEILEALAAQASEDQQFDEVGDSIDE